ncbi:type 4a pilus biogenesis protein PilO [Candidatus Sulfurimonas marisnigri]|uniref:Type 4a pilus biogenesis protein PilO n=1 Tax=Candidatus Sulfurimonas marisnigri TaxID=2740405 RepID=A0A7S7LYV8_9BACT|nr:type 4a pilus biogenesis protein PilO [Candidatus Sulfurimonas marisnigri]QOY53932.1 type 4a pilus biogenesis protein PilO [Candidatus Sulfurimonas marisnigri]
MNFKLTVEDYLQKIDNFFKEKSKKDTYYVYIMVAGVVTALAYPFYDLSVDEFTNVKKKVTEITKKINADKAFLQVNPETKIVKLNQEIKRFETELQINRDNNEYIKSKIETISSLIYDERAWGEYLSSISTNAKKYKIKIINFTNKYATNNKSFGHILDINIQLQGNYSNTLKFINSLEKSELVVDAHDISMKAEDALNTKLDISVWGITY